MTLITTADSRLIWINSRLCGANSDCESMYLSLYLQAVNLDIHTPVSAAIVEGM
jgi:hypothetical protein